MCMHVPNVAQPGVIAGRQGCTSMQLKITTSTKSTMHFTQICCMEFLRVQVEFAFVRAACMAVISLCQYYDSQV